MTNEFKNGNAGACGIFHAVIRRAWPRVSVSAGVMALIASSMMAMPASAQTAHTHAAPKAGETATDHKKRAEQETRDNVNIFVKTVSKDDDGVDPLAKMEFQIHLSTFKTMMNIAVPVVLDLIQLTNCQEDADFEVRRLMNEASRNKTGTEHATEIKRLKAKFVADMSKCRERINEASNELFSSLDGAQERLKNLSAERFNTGKLDASRLLRVFYKTLRRGPSYRLAVGENMQNLDRLAQAQVRIVAENGNESAEPMIEKDVIALAREVFNHQVGDTINRRTGGVRRTGLKSVDGIK